MDALLLALVGCLVIDISGPVARLAQALSVRFQQPRTILAGAAAAALANALLSSFAGWFVAGMIGSDARSLFFALALLSAGISLVLRPKMPDLLENWRMGGLLTAFFGIFILGFGDAAQFLVMGIVVRTADPALTAIGAGLGSSLACLIPIMIGQPFTRAPWRALRLAIGGLMLLIGALVALSALGLL